MMLHKIHLKLTLLCTLITTVIMLIMSFIYLHVSEKQLFQNQLYSFQNDLHTMETNMEQQSIISMAWISKMEAYGNAFQHDETRLTRIIFCKKRN